MHLVRVCIYSYISAYINSRVHNNAESKPHFIYRRAHTKQLILVIIFVFSFSYQFFCHITHIFLFRIRCITLPDKVLNIFDFFKHSIFLAKFKVVKTRDCAVNLI